MSTSKHLITALEKSDWLDRLLILAGLVFFILTVLFILKQRLVDRGLRIALWWTRFVPDFSGDEALFKAEEGSATVSTFAAAATSVITTVATSLTVAASAATSLLQTERSTDVSAYTSTSVTGSSSSSYDSLSQTLESLSVTPRVTVTTTVPAVSPSEKGRDEL